MPADARTNRHDQIDPAWVAAIARKVIARLKSGSASDSTTSVAKTTTNAANPTTSQTNQTAASIDDRVITAATIERLSGTPTQIFITPEAIVTPAARDQARQSGITITQTVNLPATQKPKHVRIEILDAAQPERAEAVHTQLARRGIVVGTARVMLSDTPGLDVYRQCTTRNERAVLIASMTDVQRFADEMSPTIWVLDMQRLNITEATNVVAQIVRMGN